MPSWTIKRSELGNSCMLRVFELVAFAVAWGSQRLTDANVGRLNPLIAEHQAGMARDVFFGATERQSPSVRI